MAQSVSNISTPKPAHPHLDKFFSAAQKIVETPLDLIKPAVTAARTFTADELERLAKAIRE